MGQNSSVFSVCGELEFNQEQNLKDNLKAQLLQAAEKGDHEAIWNVLSDCDEANVQLYSATQPISSPLNSPPHLAALRGNARALHALWYGKYPVDEPLHDGRTPLFFAVLGPRDKAQAVVRVLLENAKVNVNRTAQHGDSALFNATLIGRVELVNQLAAAGACVDSATHHGTTPLMVASERGDIVCIKALLSLKADVTRVSTSGSTALLSAAEFGHANTSNLLIEAGAQVDARRRGGATPLFAACAHGWAHVVDVLCLAGADVNLACTDGQTPLHAVLEWAANGRDAMVAAFGDTSHIVKLPVIKVPQPSVVDSQFDFHGGAPRSLKFQPVASASFQSPFPSSASESSLKYKTNPELKSYDRDAESPRVSRRPRSFSLPVVHEVADEDEDDDEFSQFLGPSSTLDKAGHTHSADDTDHLDNCEDLNSSSAATIRVPSLALKIIETLLNHGANTSACLIGGNGESALHLACRHGLVGCARLLAPHSNVRLPAGDSATTPLHLAARYGHTEIIDILLKADEEALLENISLPDKPLVPFVDTRDAGGEAPLHLAARFGEVGAIRKLVEAGAEVDARRLFDQATPLTVAALFNRISAAKLLVQLGASLRPMRVADLESSHAHNVASSQNLFQNQQKVSMDENGDNSKTQSSSLIYQSPEPLPVWSSPAEQAMEWGHQELADHLRAVEKAGYLAWLSAPRLQLVHLRILHAAGRAQFCSFCEEGSSFSQDPFKNPKTSGSPSRHGRLLKKLSSKNVSWTSKEVENALRFILGIDGNHHAPDNVFAIIAAFWWP